MSYVVHRAPRANVPEELGEWLYRSRTPRIVRLLSSDPVVDIRRPRRVEPELYENWLYSRLRLSASVIDSMATFGSLAYVPNPQASLTDFGLTGYANDYTLDVTVGAVTDFDVIVGVGFVQGSQQAPAAALIDYAVVFHRPPSAEAVIELVQPLFIRLQDVAAQSVIDAIVSEASAVGYSVTVLATGSGNTASQSAETHSISLSQLGVGESLSNWTVIAVPTIEQGGTGYLVEVGSVIAVAPGEAVAVGLLKSQGAVVVAATVGVSGTGYVVASHSVSIQTADPIGVVDDPRVDSGRIRRKLRSSQ